MDAGNRRERGGETSAAGEMCYTSSSLPIGEKVSEEGRG